MKCIINSIFIFLCSFSFAQTNLLDSSTWSAGTGSAPGFTRKGADAENIREMGIGPYGSSVLLWKGVTDATATNDDGGWTTETPIDPSKTYRFTVWMKKTNSNDGNTYFGVRAKDASNNWALYSLDNNLLTYPYLINGGLPVLNAWYLFVGYVHQSSYSTTISNGGLYEGSTGNKISNFTDTKFGATAADIFVVQMMHRGTPNTADALYMYAPTLYEVNGQEPTIQDLIDGSDTQAPSASTLSSAVKTETTVDLSWTASTDNTAVTGYKVFKDGVLQAALGNVLTYQVTGLTANTAYNFTVKALDAAGNESVDSNTLIITTNSSTSSNFTPEYQAVLDEATAQGYTLPSATDQNLQNQIIINAKSSGIWVKADLILYFKGSGDKNFKLINWKNPTGVKATEEAYGGALVWSLTGVKGDGLAVINSHLDLTSGGLNYTQNSAGYYVKVSQPYTTKYNLFGGDNINLSTAFQRPKINSDGSLPPVYTYPVTGLLGVSRNNASSYIASVSSFLTTLSQNSGTVTNQPLKVLGNGNATSIGSRFDGEVEYVIVGGDMSSMLSDLEVSFDSQPPSISTLYSTSKSYTTIDLSWAAATDNIGVTAYKVYKDGVLEATLGKILSYQVTDLTSGTSYDFSLTALDASGNESDFSNTINVTTNSISGGGVGSSYWNLNNQSIYYNTGNVGIGLNTSDEKLAVNGKIHTKEIRIDTDNWPDYVFAKTYNLPTLSEVAEHIKTKGHLPNIPSMLEVKANGVQLGSMNSKLLEKIEELTLYILKQEKRIENLEKQLIAKE